MSNQEIEEEWIQKLGKDLRVAILSFMSLQITVDFTPMLTFCYLHASCAQTVINMQLGFSTRLLGQDHLRCLKKASPTGTRSA